MVVDASTLFRRGRNQNTLEDEHRSRIEELYGAFVDEVGFARVADLEEIKANDFDLNISRYVAPADDEELPTLSEATAQLKPVAKGKVTAPGQVCKTMKVKGKQSPEQRAAFKACIQAAVAAKKKPPVVVEPVPTEPAPTEPAPTV